MALIKEKMTKFNILASYWRVGMVTIDTNMREVSFSLNLFMSKDSEEFIETYSISDLMGKEDKTLFNTYFRKDFGNNYKDVYTACYQYAKDNVEFFKDSVDDEEEMQRSLKK